MVLDISIAFKLKCGAMHTCVCKPVTNYVVDVEVRKAVIVRSHGPSSSSCSVQIRVLPRTIQCPKNKRGLPISTKLAVGVGNLVAGTHAKAGRHCAWLGSRVQATDLFTKPTP